MSGYYDCLAYVLLMHIQGLLILALLLFQLLCAVIPDFAQVYNFIGSVFDPNSTNHLQRLKQMDPINVETVIDTNSFCLHIILFFSACAGCRSMV